MHFSYPLIYLFHFFTHSSICFFINDLPVVIASKVRYSFSSVQLSLEIKKKKKMTNNLFSSPYHEHDVVENFFQGQSESSQPPMTVEITTNWAILNEQQFWTMKGNLYNIVWIEILQLLIQLNFITNLVNFQVTCH